MAKITKIEPQIPALPTRKKVAAYARVSMETERLHHSLSSQVSYYSELIQKNPEWEYVGVYADEAITGTIAKKRDEFKRLIADCDAGKIDIVLCKSISRFARNTVDLLETVRHLKELGISVRFEKENIDSLSGDGEVMLTLLASFAQSESESISNNVKWGVRKRMERGIPNGHFRIFGYRWEGDQLVIVPEEAAIVKRIYQNFLDGKSRLETEREFAAEGITTREGCRWVDSNIKVVLSNITYTGNMLLQKEYIADPISKKRKKNHGELKQYYVEDTHEPIIGMETFQYVQSEMARRKELGALANKSLNITCFTSKIKCEKCGKSYVRNTRKNRAKVSQLGDQLVGWVCGSSKTKNGKCKAMEIPEYILRQKCAEALGLEEFDEDAFAEQVEVITVPEQGILNFHMTDGTEKTLTWVSTAKKDSWTPEARKKASSYRRNHAMKRDDVTCFTSKIKCADCGNNYRRQTRTKASGEKYHLFVCATTNTCSNNCIHEDTLRELTAQALGQQELDEAVFLKEIDHITIAPGGHITFCFYDGHEVSMEYSTKRREGFKRMVADALAGRIDLIVTKSVSRFARNTVDSLTTIRKLKEKGVECYFEKENIWTFDGKGELLITIMSSLAQEESRSISENCTWGQRKRFADGKVTIPFNRFLGYDRGANGELVVNPEQAEVVRRIYDMFLQGLTYHGIAQKLTDDGIKTPGGKDKWSISTVKSILSNEKYKGDALLQKRFTVDYLTKKQKKNEGEIPQYYVEGNHEAIIPPEKFDMVQREMAKRGRGKKYHSGVHPFSSKIRCGECGSWYGSKVWHSTDKYRRIIWQCNHKFDGDKRCTTPHLTDEQIQDVFLSAANKLLTTKDAVITNGREMMTLLFDTTELEAERDKLLDEAQVVSDAVQQNIYENAHVALDQKAYQKKYDDLTARYETLKARLDELNEQISQMQAQKASVEDFLTAFEKMPEQLTEFSLDSFNALTDYLTVNGEGNIDVTFRNGQTIKA